MKTIILFFLISMGLLAQDNSIIFLLFSDGADLGVTLGADVTSYWKLDEASGTRADSKGVNDLSTVSSPTSETGIIGNSLGTAGGYVRNTTPTIHTGNESFTVCGWIYNNSTSNVGIADVYLEWQLFLNGNYVYFRSWNDAGSTIDRSSNSTINADTWYFIVGWYNSETDSIYLQVDNGTITQFLLTDGKDDANTQPLEIGQAAGIAAGDGRVDEFMFFNRVLTTEEKDYLYNSGSGRTFIDGKIK